MFKQDGLMNNLYSFVHIDKDITYQREAFQQWWQERSEGEKETIVIHLLGMASLSVSYIGEVERYVGRAVVPELDLSKVHGKVDI